MSDWDSNDWSAYGWSTGWGGGGGRDNDDDDDKRYGKYKGAHFIDSEGKSVEDLRVVPYVNKFPMVCGWALLQNHGIEVV